jgi:hypothetical protein
LVLKPPNAVTSPEILATLFGPSVPITSSQKTSLVGLATSFSQLSDLKYAGEHLVQL